MDKRGVSPLVATILLLFLAIGLGVIVMNWGRSQVEAASTCAVNIGFTVVELNEIQEVCYAGRGADGYIHFIVENGPSIDIDGIQLSIIGTKKIYNLELKDKIKTGYSLLKDIPYDFDNFGDIRQIKILPKIVLYEGEDALLCAEQALVLEDIRSC